MCGFKVCKIDYLLDTWQLFTIWTHKPFIVLGIVDLFLLSYFKNCNHNLSTMDTLGILNK